MIDKGKASELADYIYSKWSTNNIDDSITEWLENNQPTPVVVGLSDPQVDRLSYQLASIGNKDSGISDYMATAVIKRFLAQETFAQPEVKEFAVGLNDEQLRSLHASRFKDYLSLTDFVNNYYQWAKEEPFAQPTLQPNWDDAPDWANWFAQDEDGEMYWHESKPLQLSHSNSWQSNKNSNCEPAFVRDWKNSLRERPKPPAPTVEVGQTWQYKGSEYVVTGLQRIKGKTKINDTWVDNIKLVSYHQGSNLLNIGFQNYTRTLSDFLTKFVRVS